jgi:hypothetical protein
MPIHPHRKLNFPITQAIRILRDGVDCRCKDAEKYLRSDTGGEYGGVCLVCTICGRDIDVNEVDPKGR